MNNFYRDLRVAVIVVFAICVVTVLIQVIFFANTSLAMVKEQLFYNAYYGFPLTFILSWFFDRLDKWASWDENPKLRATVGIIATIALTMLILFILNFILWHLIQGAPLKTLFSENQKLFYLIGFLITVIVTSIIHAIGFFKEVQLEKEVSYNLRQQKLSSELNALRAHVDPHFLFNSFNVLSGLIDEDQTKAQSFLSGLSGIYRYVLEQRNEETCTLEEELGFAERYLDLQRMRFENGIELVKSIQTQHLNKRIPSLTLQLLLENAIKHNAFDAHDPLKIELSVIDDYLIVKNNLAQKKKLTKGNGVGIQNITDRYKLLTDRTIVVDQSNTNFTVKLPLL